MRILIATDAWKPQVNGVVRTYEQLAEHIGELGSEVVFLTPSQFRTLPCPTYPEIQLALPGWSYLVERIKLVAPDAIHIATEGPVGWMTRAYCLNRRIPFTTSYHTRFPDYLTARFSIPTSWTWAAQRLFHNASAGTMVATASLGDELTSRGFQHIMSWTRGVNTDLFRPRPTRLFGDEPVFLYVGRVAVEKNIEAFLKLDLPGRKVVVGGGPQLETLKSAYPETIFTGKKIGEDLAQCYASADVFVFPSRTDTFGVVLLEAMASGLPVAAYPVTGPVDLVTPGKTGILSDDLQQAALQALKLENAHVCTKAREFGLDNTARLFLSNVETAIFSGKEKKLRARHTRLVRQTPSV